ncbi:Aldo/keto reductase [Punctularia strigosozonata HHB-11173 SS5]|uniref:Aldo/keto reductase n=1 Tax=Punctularia strigosozonata (strain HHB-11173) TaxID=741275 RepID=UPI0004418466|nr:Aldo/keto reductase [Punctularia strigosozonata HHB-11173 SS5]EIN12820.1 Aldo/keto reductase [Punctularia strigosozonata HHB-11173 SS5]
MPFETVTLNDGNEIPALAFGTGTALYGRDATDYVTRAIDHGFSHIDTAQAYQNEASVGVAIKESGLPRSDLYITTKYGGGKIQDEIRNSLQKLGIKQVDLYLIHQPGLVRDNLESAWKDFEQIKQDGLSKSIGVSNFTVEDLQKVIKTAKIKPAVNQIRFHPYNYAEHKGLLEYSAKHGIVTEAYSSLTYWNL